MQQKENAYFRRIYDKYVDEIYKYVYIKVNFNQHLAEDITQETFLSVYKGLDSYKKLSSEKTWVYSIACNKVNDYYREYYRHLPSLDYEDPANDLAAADKDEIESSITRNIVKGCLKELPEVYRNVLLLKYLDGYSIKEIAGILDRSVKSIDNLLLRAKRRFTELYQEEEET